MMTKNLFGLREALPDPCLEEPVNADINIKTAPNRAPMINTLITISRGIKKVFQRRIVEFSQ